MHTQNAVIFFPQIGGKRQGKPYLEVLSRFGLWRGFLNNNGRQETMIYHLIVSCGRVMTRTRCRSEIQITFRFLRFYVFYHDINAKGNVRFPFRVPAEKGVA